MLVVVGEVVEALGHHGGVPEHGRVDTDEVERRDGRPGLGELALNGAHGARPAGAESPRSGMRALEVRSLPLASA
jgi:hypothetical protein